MDLVNFRKWLRNKYDTKTVSSRIANCSRVEQFEGNLDKYFEEDKCRELLNRLTYTKEDEAHRREPRHCIPINGNKFNGTSTLKHAISLYVKFKNNDPVNNLIKVKQPRHLPSKDNNEIIKKINDEFFISSSSLFLLAAFRLILPVLAKFIGDKLIENDRNNWWRNLVRNKLKNDNTIRILPKEGTNDECINNLDMTACLNIIDCNWQNIFKNTMTDRQRTWAHELKDYRNNYEAHYTINTLKSNNDKDTLRALDTMERFMRPINVDIADKLVKMKERFELLI